MGFELPSARRAADRMHEGQPASAAGPPPPGHLYIPPGRLRARPRRPEPTLTYSDLLLPTLPLRGPGIPMGLQLYLVGTGKGVVLGRVVGAGAVPREDPLADEAPQGRPCDLDASPKVLGELLDRHPVARSTRSGTGSAADGTRRVLRPRHMVVSGGLARLPPRASMELQGGTAPSIEIGGGGE